MPYRLMSTPRLARILNRARSFRSDEGGVVFVIFGLCCFLLFGFVFVAVEYAGAARSDTAMQVAADNGALSAAKAAGENPSATEADLQSIAAKAVAGNLENWAKNGLTVTLTKGTADITVTVCGDYEYQSSIATTNSTQQVCATAKSNIIAAATGVPLDIHFVIDTSASMGLAADKTGRDELKTLTKNGFGIASMDKGPVKEVAVTINNSGYYFGVAFEGCQFACHVATQRAYETNLWIQVINASNGMPNQPHFRLGAYAGPIYANTTKSTEQIARDAGIRLRIDAAKDAAKSVVDEAETAIAAGGDIKFSISTFHDQAATILSPDGYTSIETVRTDLAGLQIGSPGRTAPTAAHDAAHTDSSTMSDIVRNVTGFGRPAERKQYFMLVTDGVNGVVGGNVNKGTVSLFAEADCKKLKAVGTVGVLYLKYLEPQADDTVTKNILKIDKTYENSDFYDNIEPNMRTCASDPSLFFMADESAAVKTAMKQLFAAIQNHAGESAPRLTQ